MVLNKLACELVAVEGRDFSAVATALVLEPLAFKDVSVRVVHLAGQLAIVLLHVPLVELAIREEDLHVAVLELPAVKASFYYLVGWTEQDSLSLGAIFAPISLIDGSVDELADAGAVPLVILPLALIDVTTRQNHLALAMLCAL